MRDDVLHLLQESRTTDQVPPDIILHQFEFTTCELKREQESRRENERIEREKERPEAEKRERTGRQQAEQQRVAIERERLESEEQERQRLEEAELKRRSLASQGTPERQGMKIYSSLLNLIVHRL